MGLHRGRKRKNIFDKDELMYTIMIRQLNFISDEIFEEGMCVQIMHIGSFVEEAKTFEVMENLCKENNLTIKSKAHREIYISDFRKTAPEKLKNCIKIQSLNY